MNSWLEKILEDFTEPIPHLSLVSDPDRFLTEESILTALREKEVEVVEYGEGVAFRYLYELKYRRAVEERTSRLIVRTAEETLDHLPFDLLQAGRRLEYRLSRFFPRLSLPVLRELDREELGVLYSLYEQYQGSNSDTETCEFILRKVYKVAYDTIDTETELLKLLLSKHGQEKRYPPVMEEFLLEQLRRVKVLRKIPLAELITSEAFFFAYLQEQWLSFLLSMQEEAEKARENPEDGVYRLEHPFMDPDARRLLDNLFLEGKLQPVSGVNSRLLPTWTHPGIKIDRDEEKKNRLTSLIKRVTEKLLPVMTYRDWLRLAPVYAEAKNLLYTLDLSKEQAASAAWQRLEADLNQGFAVWLERKFGGLKNLPYLPEPVMVHHIPHYLAAKRQQKVALVVLDGMSYPQWAQIRQALSGDGQEFAYHEQGVFAWIPTTTPLSRQAIFSGEIPMYFASSLYTTSKEEAAWRLFWENHNLPRGYTAYVKGLGQGAYQGLEVLEESAVRVIGLVVDTIDRLLHRAILGQQGIYSEIALWMKEGYLRKLLADLIARDYEVYLTSDHGNQEAKGIGKLSEGVLVESQGERVRIYQDQFFRDQAAARRLTLIWPGDGLPEGYLPLLARSGEAFVRKGARVVSHGGISLEEVIVPFIRIKELHNSIV